MTSDESTSGSNQSNNGQDQEKTLQEGVHEKMKEENHPEYSPFIRKMRESPGVDRATWCHSRTFKVYFNRDAEATELGKTLCIAHDWGYEPRPIERHNRRQCSMILEKTAEPVEIPLNDDHND